MGVTPREDRLTRQGAALLLAHFDGDSAGRDQLLGPALEDGTHPRPDGIGVDIADGLAIIAVVGATMLAQASGQTLSRVLGRLPQPSTRLLPPPAPMPWAEAIALVEAVPQSNDAAAAAAQQMDGPGAVNALFAVGVSAFTQLQSQTGADSSAMLQGVIDAPRQA